MPYYNYGYDDYDGYYGYGWMRPRFYRHMRPYGYYGYERPYYGRPYYGHYGRRHNYWY